MNKTGDELRLCALLRECLKEGFDLFDSSHPVGIHMMDDGFWAGYTMGADFDAIGRQLYLCLEKFAQEVGCHRAILTPSGVNRDQFWASLGFMPVSRREYEKQL